MLIRDLYRINKEGNMKFLTLRTEDTGSQLHIIFNKENNTTMVFKYISNKNIIFPMSESAIAVDILSDAQNPLGYIEHNNLFKDYDSNAHSIYLGEIFLEEFIDIYEGINGVDIDIDEQYYIDTQSFLDNLFIHLYNKISQYNIIPIEQIFNTDFKEDENSIKHTSQFQYFYRRMLTDDDDETYENLYHKINKYREPKEFNFINRIMRAKPGTMDVCPIDFIMEFYCIIKYIKLIQYKKEKISKDLEDINTLSDKIYSEGNN